MKLSLFFKNTCFCEKRLLSIKVNCMNTEKLIDID